MTSLSIPNSFSAGTPIASSPMNANFTAITSWANGNIDNGNIKSGAAIALSKLDNTTQFLSLMTANSLSIGSGVTGDPYPRVSFNSSGRLEFGSGSATTDVAIKRNSSTELVIRDVADAADRDLKARNLTASTALKLVNTNTMTLTPAALAADRAITVKDPGASANLIFSTGSLAANGILYSDGTNILCGSAGSYSSSLYTSQNAPLFAGGRLVVNNTTDAYADGNGTTLYYLPAANGLLSLYDGSAWQHVAIGTASVNISAPATALTGYDVYAYLSAGAIVLELVAFSSSTSGSSARTGSLSALQGALVKTGDSTRRWLGMAMTSSLGSWSDAVGFRGVYNHYNKILKQLKSYGDPGSATSWTYATNTFRAMNSDTTAGVPAATRLTFLSNGNTGIDANLSISVTNTGAAGTAAAGIGLNSTTTAQAAASVYIPVANTQQRLTVSLNGINSTNTPPFGCNYLQALEASVSGTTTYQSSSLSFGGATQNTYTFGATVPC